MKTVKLTAEEIRAVGEFLWANPCRSGYAYSEMEKSKKDCWTTRYRLSIF